MKKFTALAIIAVIWTGMMPGIGWGVSESTADPANIAGIWLGVIKIPSGELRIAFEISEAKESGYTAVIHSIDQGNKHIPASTVTMKGDSLRLEVKSLFAYEGRLQTDGNIIDGNWIQGGLTPLVMKRVDKLPDIAPTNLNRPQDPQKPYPYIEEEVVYENIKAGVRLAGTLTIPRDKGPFPAVVLLTGSGEQNRNEESFSHRPFLVLADYLTRQGIAVLRADDRGVGGSTGDMTKSTSGDYADDALAGVEYLKGRKEIDAKRIGLVGHSEGGMMAPIAATQSTDVAFIVMLAGLGQRMADIIIFQVLYEAKAQGADENTLALKRSWYERFFALVAENTDNAVAEEKIHALHATLTADEKEKLCWQDDKLADKLAEELNPWWRYAMQYNPRATLMKVRCPVLALNGEKDMQVPAKENLAAIEEALKAGGNTQFTVRELPGLNHAFQTAPPGMELEYFKIEETMSPLALQTVSEWIREQAVVKEVHAR